MDYSKFLLVACLLVGSVGLVGGSPDSSHSQEKPLTVTSSESGTLVFADFETKLDNRPVSTRGGFIQLTSYQENDALQSSFKGMEGANPAAPDLVRISKDSPNKAISFDYRLMAPNQWAGVGVEIHGQPDKDGKSVADDVSGYKYLTLQAYSTGVSTLRVEFLSRGQGIVVSNGYPQMTFKVSPGFNTYKVPFKSLEQPKWAEPKVSTKEVLKKLTAISVTAYCGPCTQVAGTVVIDNMVFQN